MHKSMCRLLAAAAIWLCLMGTAFAETAENITQDCLYNGSKSASIRDDSYRTVWESTRNGGIHSITVEAPEGKTIGGILIRWKSWPLALQMEKRNEAGEWETTGGCEADFLAQYIPVDQLPAVRLLDRETQGNTKLEISGITVFTPGDLPKDAQVWRKPADKVDLMLLAAHPDDEMLWFGGLLPYYAGERQKEVLVVNTAFARDDRRLELLDCLWTCGVRAYPVFLAYPDVCTNQKDLVLARWGWENILGDVVGLYRRYRPDVVMLHAENGEYGHGVHRVISQAGRDAADAAKSAEHFPQSAAAYGVWNVPKIYMHMYAENQIRLNWHVPLAAFEGKTAFEVADEGFQCHRSQLGGEWFMQSGGENDNSLFGLWRSTVGEDSGNDDLFENIVSNMAD